MEKEQGIEHVSKSLKMIPSEEGYRTPPDEGPGDADNLQHLSSACLKSPALGHRGAV